LADAATAHQPIEKTRLQTETLFIAVTNVTLGPTTGSIRSCEEIFMLHYAVVFFVIALIAAVFGFGGIAASAVGIGKILFMVFAVLSIVSFLLGLGRKR
jgi:uncharacterized membrane protein YtjA (UPF0391 family)